MIAPAEYRTVPEPKPKPVPDEETLAKLLEAAYVLQEHNREMRRLEFRPAVQEDQAEVPRVRNLIATSTQPERRAERTPSSDVTSTLERIAETQRLIQVQRMDFDSALKLVAKRVSEMTNAAGAAIGIIEGKSVRYRAINGSSTPILESVIPVDKAMFAPCLKTGRELHSGDVEAESLLDAEECKRRGIGSLIAVPVYHDGGIAGGLELYYRAPNAFSEPDVHTSQLMAGLIAEALLREEEATWRKSLATERAAMLEALEKLQPNLAALVEKPAVKIASTADTPEVASNSYSCRKCGHRLVAEEQFCGQCGTPRAADYEAANIQSKVASLWLRQESQKKDAVFEPGRDEVRKAAEKSSIISPETSLARSLEEQLPDLFTPDELEFEANHETANVPAPLNVQEITGIELGGVAIDAPETTANNEQTLPDSQALSKAETTHAAHWRSAASARAFLEQFASSKRGGTVLQFWSRHRGDIYLAVAVVLVLCVIRWGLWSRPHVKATGTPTTAAATHRKPAGDPALSLFDRMLIQFGLAEAPDPPTDKGKPGVQVWVDQRTALYYCPGADLYGKTPKGKFTTQREAQLDQFEPAYRRVCD